MRQALKWGLLCLLLASCGGSQAKSNARALQNAEKAAKSTGQRSLLNQEYHFQLLSPPGFQLLDEAAAAGVHPDALAGLRSGALVGVVLIEDAHGGPLKQVADAIVASMDVQNKVIALEEKRYLNLDCIEYRVSGRVRNIPAVFVGRVFLRQGFAHQIAVFSESSDLAPEKVAHVFSAFSLGEGSLPKQAESRAAQNLRGAGWQIEKGVYRNENTGLQVAPLEGWEIAVGAKAREVNTEAEVVLIHSKLTAYYIVVSREMEENALEGYREKRLLQLLSRLDGRASLEQRQGTFLEENAVLTRLRVEGSQLFDSVLGYKNGISVYGLGWYVGPDWEQGQEALEAAMVSVSMR